MNPDRWQQITEAFHVALDRDAAARAAYLDEACAGDPALRADVDAMIAAHLGAGSFGKQPLGVPPGLNDAGRPGRCSHCGSPLLAEPGLPGMCPQCLLGLALQEPDESAARFHAGRIIGDRYQVLEALGHGGMGDVFKALRSQAARPCGPQGHPRRPRCQRTRARVSAKRSAIGA